MSKQRWRGGWACSCMVTILPLVEEEMILRGLVDNSIDYFQLAYNTSVNASAMTHAGGGVFDTGQYSDAHLKVWRQWGCEVQHRTPAQKFSHHGHGVIKGCPHVSKGRSGAQWQLDEWEIGNNGLRGRGPITGPGPKGNDTPTWKKAKEQREPILMALKDEIAAAVVAQLKKEYPKIAAAMWAADVIPNTFSGNPANKTVPASYAMQVLGSRTNDIGKQVLSRDDIIPNEYDLADPNDFMALGSAAKLLMRRQREQQAQLDAIQKAVTEEPSA